MAQKYDVTFSSPTKLSPSYVYVSPSEAYPGRFSAGILYPISVFGEFQSPAGLTKVFDLEQHLVGSEEQALQWARQWLSERSATNASLVKVIAEV